MDSKEAITAERLAYYQRYEFPNLAETKGAEQPAVGDCWECEEDMTTAINEFEKLVAVEIDNGIQYANLPANLNLINEIDPNGIPRLVTRREQRSVVETAYKKSREILEDKTVKWYVSAIRGSPGIGKSWSALLYLQHLLEERQRPIIFESGQLPENRTVRLFVFESDAWVAHKLAANVKLPEDWQKFEGKDVIIDPAQFAGDAKPVVSALLGCMGHIFIPVSPDDSHLGGSRKGSKRTQLVLGPWSYQEIMVAWPLMVYKSNTNWTNEELAGWEHRIKERYDLFGGLPRYLLDDSKAKDRLAELTTDTAITHQRLLFSALQDAKINDRKKVVTLFLTLYPGTDEAGNYDPDLHYSTVEFVSRGALKAAGHVIFHQLEQNIVWRNRNDASSVGLAFEAACLMFLHMGTKGMKDLGISMHCRELLRDGQNKPAVLDLQYCPYDTNQGSQELIPVVEAANETEFYESVKAAGDQLEISDSDTLVTISSAAQVSFPPPGLANVDGMSGTRLNFQMTLQDNHPPLGSQYIHQREQLGLNDEESLIVYAVPHYKYKHGWNNYQKFKWKKQGEEKEGSSDDPPRKRRRGASSLDPAAAATAAAAASRSFSAMEMNRARTSLRQFVLAFTLDAEVVDTLKVSAPREAEEKTEAWVGPSSYDATG